MNFDYSSLTIDKLIEKISTARYFNLPKMVAEALKKLKTVDWANIINKPTEPKVLKAYISVDNGGNVNTSLTEFKNTLGNTNPIVVAKSSTGVYTLTSTGAFTGNLFRVVNVSGSQETRLDILKNNNNQLTIVNRSLTASSTTVDILSNGKEFFTIELY